MTFEEYNKYTKRDLLKDIIITVIMIIAFFAYWMAMLLILSIFLLNIWHISIIQVTMIAGGLTLITSIVYIYRLVKRRQNV